jgi:hypothetical protein
MENSRQLRDPVTLPSGLVFKNRLLKVGNNRRTQCDHVFDVLIGSNGRDHVKVS